MEKKQSTNKKIKCDVNNCIYNNIDDEICNLNEIKVSCNCSRDEATDKKETICDSFECSCDCKNDKEEE